MDAAQKFFQSLLLNSTAKTYRLENDQKTDFDEDNEIENAEEPSNSSNKSQSSSSDLKGRLKISLNNARYGRLCEKTKITIHFFSNFAVDF